MNINECLDSLLQLFLCYPGAAFGPLLAGVISPTGWQNVFYALIAADIAAMLVCLATVYCWFMWFHYNLCLGSKASLRVITIKLFLSFAAKKYLVVYSGVTARIRIDTAKSKRELAFEADSVKVDADRIGG